MGMPTFILNLYERFGLNAYISGDYDKAERWFRKLEAKEPESIAALRNLGVILMAKGDADGAERYILKEEKIYAAPSTATPLSPTSPTRGASARRRRSATRPRSPSRNARPEVRRRPPGP